MSGWRQELFDAWVMGELPDDEALLLEVALQSDPDAAVAFDRWLRRSAERDIDQGPSPLIDAEGVVELAEGARVVALRRSAPPSPRWWSRPAALAAAAVIGAALALGAAWWQGLDDRELARTSEEICEEWRQDAPTGLHPSLSCGEPTSALLGSAPRSLPGPRTALDSHPRPRDPDWLAARALVSVLERNPDEAIELLQRHEDLLTDAPRLRADLAAAYLQKGDVEAARAQLRRGLLDAPDDPALLHNLETLDLRSTVP
jgi:hypothetical protein